MIFFKNRLRFDKIVVMSLWPRRPAFLAHPVYRRYVGLTLRLDVQITELSLNQYSVFHD